MGRLLQLILLVALAVLVWRVVRKALAPPQSPAAPPSFEPTARCTACGTHVPANELDASGRCPRCRARE